MNIEVLAGNTVKITLDRNDMTDYDVKYENLSKKSPDTKRLLIELLSAVRLEKNLDLGTGRLFIEAFPRNDGGCMLYISSIGGTSSMKTDEEIIESIMEETSYASAKPSTLVCESDTAEEMGELCRRLLEFVKDSVSSLYVSQEKVPVFRLIITQTESFRPIVMRLISEYGKIVGASDSAAETEEYFKCVINDKAVLTAGKIL